MTVAINLISVWKLLQFCYGSDNLDSERTHHISTVIVQASEKDNGALV